MNFVEIVRLGGDATQRFTQAGKPVLSFRAAYDVGFGDRKRTEWLDCSLWGERGTKIAEYLTKGTLIQVQGTVGTKEYEGKVSLALDVLDVKLLGGTKRTEESYRNAGKEKKTPVLGDDFDADGLPNF